jgi:peptidoglycan/LPS O-acetylase OafA/YrhL
MGASGEVKGKFSSKICKFLGDISYPIYITHYPVMYIYTGWIADKGQPAITSVWVTSLLVLVTSILVAWVSLKLYDEPVRNWLQKKFLRK